jgi:hypothetical protein
MKKISLFVAIAMLSASCLFARPLTEVNEKVLKAFSETFKNVKDVSWHEYENYYEVNFKQSEIISRVRYDKDGNVIGSTRYYKGDQLPPQVLSSIKKKYPGKTIYGVTEVSSDEDIQYSITLEDEKKWYSVTSNAYGGLQLISKFNKAPTE